MQEKGLSLSFNINKNTEKHFYLY